MGIEPLIILVSATLPVITGLAGWKRATMEIRLGICYCMLCVVTEAMNEILATTIRNNMYSLNTFNLLEFILLFSYTWRFSNSRFSNKYFLFTGLLIYLVLWLLENFIIFRINESNFYLLSIGRFVIMLMLFGRIAKMVMYVEKPLLKNPVFYFDFHLIIVFMFGYFTTIFSNFRVFSEPTMMTMHYINLVILVLTNIFLSIGYLWLQPMKRSLSASS